MTQAKLKPSFVQLYQFFIVACGKMDLRIDIFILKLVYNENSVWFRQLSHEIYNALDSNSCMEYINVVAELFLIHDSFFKVIDRRDIYN
jgi:hypothetical protein